MSDNDIPKMIREDQPITRPTPPGLGSPVDAAAFDQRWEQERQRSETAEMAKGPERRIDTFNRKADELGHAEARMEQARSAEQEAVDQFVASFDERRLIEPERVKRIRQMARTTMAAEDDYRRLSDYAHPVNLERPRDAFDRIDEQVQGRDRSRGIDQER